MQIQLWFARFLYSRVSGLVFTTQPLLEELIQQVGISLAEKQTVVIPNLVNLQLIEAQAQIEPAHHWLRHKEKPVICLDLGGPAVQVTAETGFKILAHDPDQAVREMAIAITQLAKEPALRSQLGIDRTATGEFTYINWETKGKRLVEVYATIVSQQGEINARSHGS